MLLPEDGVHPRDEFARKQTCEGPVHVIRGKQACTALPVTEEPHTVNEYQVTYSNGEVVGG